MLSTSSVILASPRLQPSYEQEDEIFQAFVARYPNLKCIARHVRYAHSGSENSLKAFLWYENHTFESKLFTFNILDRVGVAYREEQLERIECLLYLL